MKLPFFGSADATALLLYEPSRSARVHAAPPEYGDTVIRAFDFVDAWRATPGRF